MIDNLELLEDPPPPISIHTVSLRCMVKNTAKNSSLWLGRNHDRLQTDGFATTKPKTA